MNTLAATVRPASHTDLAALAELAAVTFPLACPPGSTAQDQQEFIDSVLSVDRFAEYLADRDVKDDRLLALFDDLVDEVVSEPAEATS